MILKFAISVAISLYGGSAFIEYYRLTGYSLMSQGFVMLIFAVFGMLMIGISYQSLRLMKGKPAAAVISEVKRLYCAVQIAEALMSKKITIAQIQAQAAELEH